MPKEATLEGYSPESVLPTARWFSDLSGFNHRFYLDNFKPYSYDWDSYHGRSKIPPYHLQSSSTLPTRVTLDFVWPAPTTTYVTLETEKTFECWALYEAQPNELGFGLAEIYAKSQFDNLGDRGTILEPETRMEILKRRYNSQFEHQERSADLFMPQFVLCFSGEEKLQIPDELRIKDGRVIANPPQLPFRTVGQIDIEASRKRMAYVTAKERGGGSPQEIDLRKANSVQRAVDHLIRLRGVINREFSDIHHPVALKIFPQTAS